MYQITIPKCSGPSPRGVCIPLQSITVRINIWCHMRKFAEAIMPWKPGRCAWTWVGKCALKTFPLESDQSLPLELAKHNPYGRPEVVIGVCIDHERGYSSKVASLDRKGGGTKSRIWWSYEEIFHTWQKILFSQTNWLRLLLRWCLYTITKHHSKEPRDFFLTSIEKGHTFSKSDLSVTPL